MSDAVGGVVKQGTVKWWDGRLGYGFILNPENRDVFVHYDALPGERGKRNLQDGDIVTYVEQAHPKGLRAAKVLQIERRVVVN